jgi:hypothetical protein
MRLIGISGKARSGKDTLADYMVNAYGWHKVSLARPLKDFCKEYFGLTEDQVNGVLKEAPTHHRKPNGSFYTGREILCKVGQDMRNIDPNIWINRLKDEILKTPQAQMGTYVISDIRFINEAKWLQSYSHGYVIRLERDVHLRGVDSKDISETQLDDYRFDLRFGPLVNRTMKDIPVIANDVFNYVSTHRQVA